MRIKISIAGITPLLCNRFTDAAAEQSTDGTGPALSTGDRGTPLEIAQAALYIGLDGREMIPQPNLLRCIVDGGRFHKIGKTQITTQRGSLLYAAVDVLGAEIPIEHKQPWRVDTRPVRIPATGGRILKHRPCFDDWKLSFECELDTSMIGEKLFRAIVDDAGKKLGLGDFRPSCKGPFGRWVVTHWAVVEATRTMPIAA